MNNSYALKLKDPRWQKKRLEILQRDDWKCAICDSTDNTLVVHHRLYLPNHEPWDYPDELLVTLCEDCHLRESDNSEAEQMIIRNLKAKFFSNDIFTIAYSFEYLPQPKDFTESFMIANSIEYLLSHKRTLSQIMDKVDKEYHRGK